MSGPSPEDRSPTGPVLLFFRFLSLVAGIMVAIMMFVTAIDVAGRYLFNSPLFAAFEVTEILMGLLIFAGLPLATGARENITISILTENLPKRIEAVGTRVFEFLCGCVCLAMGWRMWAYGERLWRTGDRTLELQVPIGLLAQIMAALVILTAVAFFINAFRGRPLLSGTHMPVE